MSDAEQRLKQLEFVKKFDDEHRRINSAIERKEYLIVLKSYKQLLIDDLSVNQII